MRWWTKLLIGTGIVLIPIAVGLGVAAIWVDSPVEGNLGGMAGLIGSIGVVFIVIGTMVEDMG